MSTLNYQQLPPELIAVLEKAQQETEIAAFKLDELTANFHDEKQTSELKETLINAAKSLGILFLKIDDMIKPYSKKLETGFDKGLSIIKEDLKKTICKLKSHFETDSQNKNTENDAENN